MSKITMIQIKGGTWKVLRNGRTVSYHLYRDDARRKVAEAKREGR